MLDFLYKYRRDYIFSQNGEEGIVEECWRRLSGADHSMLWLMPKGHAVEIGAHNGRFCSNTARLLTSGWTGLFVEADWNLYQECVANWEANNPKPRCQCCHVDGRNINAFVKDNCDLLSLDTDGGDYQIFKGLQPRPKIVIVEIDSSIPPDSDTFNSDGAAGYKAMTQLALNRGYFLLCHTGNLILVRDEYINLFSEVWGTHPIRDYEKYFNRAWLKEVA